VTQEMLKEIRDDINGKANRHDIEIIGAETEDIKKSFSNIASKHEMKGYMDVITKDMNNKFKDRPT
jgi:hypothetical protein